MILAGDIGGTKVVLAAYDGPPGQGPPIAQTKFPSADFRGLEEIIESFVHTTGLTFTQATLGIAGPIKKGSVQTTNLPWKIQADTLSQKLQGAPVTLLNDLVANAWGIAGLQERELATLYSGKGADSEGNRALLSAGTGLGMAGLYWDGHHHWPLASEGGHTSFAPQDEIDIELFLHLKKKYHGTVSWERVLCGKALVDIFHFLCHQHQQQVPRWLEEEMVEGDAAAAITRAGENHQWDLATQALHLFVKYYGAQAGNTALTFCAQGGLYLGGGIAPKILTSLQKNDFIEAYLHKGRMREFLEGIPVYVILNPQTALLGAALYAFHPHHLL